MFAVRTPGPALSSHVETLWYYDGYRKTSHRERVLPNTRFQIIFDLTVGPGAVVGPRSQYLELDTAPIQTVMGIVFRPGGALAFLEHPAEEFANQVVPLDSLWSRLARELHARLQEKRMTNSQFAVLERSLLDVLSRRSPLRHDVHPAVRYALNELSGGPTVRRIRELTKDIGLSSRRFSQLFREQVGFTPKTYCRLLRFEDVVRRVAIGLHVDWADVALAGGYYDQAHLTHEFRAFSGLSPGAYLAAARPFDDHVLAP